MGTKNNPGNFDCYAKLADDEPYFVLRAKDPIAPFLVGAWRMMRAGDFHGAQQFITNAEGPFLVSGRSLLEKSSEKSKESYNVMLAMKDWETLTRAAERLSNAISSFNRIIDGIEQRCMAVDGPVTPTLQEMKEKELRNLWLAIQAIKEETESN